MDGVYLLLRGPDEPRDLRIKIDESRVFAIWWMSVFVAGWIISSATIILSSASGIIIQQFVDANTWKIVSLIINVLVCVVGTAGVKMSLEHKYMIYKALLARIDAIELRPDNTDDVKKRISDIDAELWRDL